MKSFDKNKFRDVLGELLNLPRNSINFSFKDYVIYFVVDIIIWTTFVFIFISDSIIGEYRFEDNVIFLLIFSSCLAASTALIGSKYNMGLYFYLAVYPPILVIWVLVFYWAQIIFGVEFLK